jgi:hypothetical protein
MKKIKIAAATFICAALLSACASKFTAVDFTKAPDTEHCQYMKDACKEAQAFQGQYERMNPEEKKDAKVILNACIQQCEDAVDLCRKSVE